MLVKLGICVAYDWEFLKYSLPAIYEKVDSICLSIDVNKTSWNGNTFSINIEALKDLIAGIDHKGKVFLLEESFYDHCRNPIENECYQRKRMAEVLGRADWYVQIDTDEILINPDDFIQTLSRYKNSSRPLNVHGIWMNLIKKTETGFVYSVNKTPPLATNKPVYEYGRTNGHFNIYTNSFIAHITWARPEEEVYYKLQNWGHSHEFNGISYFKIWQALDDNNWIYIKDFHPIDKGRIEKLHFHPASTIEEFTSTVQPARFRLKQMETIRNNIWISRICKFLRLK